MKQINTSFKKLFPLLNRYFKKYTIRLIPKVRIEMAVDEGDADQVMGLIRESARTGQVGDGKILVQDVENAFRIRTGETGRSAL